VNRFLKKALAALIASLPAAQADLLQVSAGAGLWQAEPTGSLRYEETDYWMNAEDQLGYEAEQMPYLWVDLKHAVPFAPNLRLEYTKVSFEGYTQGLINMWGWNLYLSDSTWSEMEVDEYDAILYYSLLDGFHGLSLDAGLDLRYVKARYMIRDDYEVGATYEETGYFIVPQGYARLRAEIPMTGIGLEGDFKYIEGGDSYIYDTRVKLDYTYRGFGIEAGYRKQRIWINEKDYSTKVDVNADGFYMGATVRF
jgi:outer membrane protein